MINKRMLLIGVLFGLVVSGNVGAMLRGPGSATGSAACAGAGGSPLLLLLDSLSTDEISSHDLTALTNELRASLDLDIELRFIDSVRAPFLELTKPTVFFTKNPAVRDKIIRDYRYDKYSSILVLPGSILNKKTLYSRRYFSPKISVLFLSKNDKKLLEEVHDPIMYSGEPHIKFNFKNVLGLSLGTKCSGLVKMLLLMQFSTSGAFGRLEDLTRCVVMQHFTLNSLFVLLSGQLNS